MKLIPALALALLVTALYAVFASYMWWTAGARLQVEGLEGQKSVLLDGIRYVQEQQQVQVERGDAAVAEVSRTFTEFREVVREVAVDSLDSEFDPRVRTALCEAVRATNRELPTARDGRSSAPADRDCP